MADAADVFRRAHFHRACRHIDRRPKFILIAVRIGEANDRAFIPVGGGLHGIGVGNFMLIEPPQVTLDIFGSDIKAAARHVLAQFLRRRVVFRLKEGADTAGFIVPPHKAKDRRILFAHVGGEPVDRSYWKPSGMHRPITPTGQIVGPDDVVIDPMHCSFRFNVIHEHPSRMLN